jgi:ABC-type Mn2+/Zn2+ transport system permease subunit
LRETLELFGPALAASLLVALACAVVGVHVVGRRLVLVGLALPQVAAAGIGLSFLAETAPWTEGGPLGWTRDHEGMALLACVAATLLLHGSHVRGGRGEVRTAAVYCLAGALSFLLVMGTAQGMEEIRTLVAGDVLGVHGERLGRLAIYLVPVIVLHGLLLRRFLFVSFDPEAAATLGIRVRLHDALFHATLAVAVAGAVHFTGTLFTFALLVLPAAGAFRVASRAGAVLAVAAGLAVVGAGAGFLVALHPEVDSPPGPTATAAAFLLFLGCLAWRWTADRLARRAAA